MRPGRWSLAVVLAAGLLAASEGARAHTLRFATVFLSIGEDGTVRGALREGSHLTVAQAKLTLHGDGCRPIAGTHEQPLGPGLWRLAWRCAPEAPNLRLAADGLTASARIHVRWRDARNDAVRTGLLGRGERLELLAGQGGRAGGSVVLRYLAMGVQHILEGADHLAFVLLLTLLAAGLRALLLTVTAFTVGHSITLAIAALGAAPPSAPVEALVALSIVLAAREAYGGVAPGLLGRRPALAAGAFGLLHGLAFASALREAGLPRDAAVAGLFGFNVGVELGQVLVVLAWVAAGRLLGLGRCARGRCTDAGPLAANPWLGPLQRYRRPLAAVAGVWAAFLFFERATVVLARPGSNGARAEERVASARPVSFPARRDVVLPDGGARPAARDASSERGLPSATDRPAAPLRPDPFAVSPSRSTSLGSPADGSLLGGILAPAQGPGFVADPRKLAARRYGTVETVRAVVRAFAEVEQRYPGSVAWLGDISAKRGGPIRGHRTHQAGRDVDVSFYLLDEAGQPRTPVVTFFDQQGRAVDFRDLKDPNDDVPLRLDVRRTWALVQALLEDPDPDARVQRILLAAHLHELLRAEGERQGAPAPTLARFEEVSCQPRWAPHDDHLHVRFFCSAEDIDRGCTDLRPVYAWRIAELRRQGARPRLAEPGRRRKTGRTRSVAEARAAAGPMDEAVERWLDRRETWMREGPARRPCRPDSPRPVSPESPRAP